MKMQRYRATGSTSAVNNNSIGGASGRDSFRPESATLPAHLPINSRRPSPIAVIAPYKLKCEKDSLNARLGPPDFHPQIPNCPEETLTREYVQSGYRETVDGIEESREISLSQVQGFSKPLAFIKCREAIKKRHRAINESRAQKRKVKIRSKTAGQVYGVALADSLLTKPGCIPEQRHCGEDLRRKWIEGLSQQHKHLRSLADHVPHGYRKRSLFEVLTRNNVPLLRATWFVKVTYLNQIRPASSNVSGIPDKTQLSRTELWTKDVIEYLQYLLDEFLSRKTSVGSHNRDRPQQILYGGSVSQRSDPASSVLDVEEPSLHFRWWYVVRLLQWHHAEGLLLPTLVIEWVLRQLQEKESLEIVQLLLPIIYGVLETVVLSQTYVRNLVGTALRFLREPSQGGSDLVDNSRRAYIVSALVEMIRYLIISVPDSFVALDCFPLPPCVVSCVVNDGTSPKLSDDVRMIKTGSGEVASVFKSNAYDAQYQSFAFDHVVSSIQKRADNLEKATSPSYPVHSIAKAVQALDISLMQGDVLGAYRFLFEDPSDGIINERWVAEVSPDLRTSLKWIGNVDLSFICSVFFLCEWATCDYRDFQTAPPSELKFSGRKNFSQVHVAAQLLSLKIRDIQSSPQHKNDKLSKGSGQQIKLPVRNSVGSSYESKNKSRVQKRSVKLSDIYESPDPLHDVIVCWIDQHDVCKGEGLKRLQFLVIELICSGIFYPAAYVRQLIVSGIMDINGPAIESDRRKRHYQVLKMLPGILLHDALQEAGVADGKNLMEALCSYSNERRLILRTFLGDHNKYMRMKSALKQKNNVFPVKDGGFPVPADQWNTTELSSNIFLGLDGKRGKRDADVEELKEAISLLLQLPHTSNPPTDTGLEESQGSSKRPFELISNKMMGHGEVTPGCEECRKTKRQKVSEERRSYTQGNSPIPSDDDDTWWMRKIPKSLEPPKVELPVKFFDPKPVKLTKQVSKNRQKGPRKTQSLAQIAASRIEASQGASTSHDCNNKINCPLHRSGLEGEALKPMEATKMNHAGDIALIGKALKRLRFPEKRTITVWLMSNIRQLVEETEKTIAKVGQFGRNLAAVDDRNSVRWKLGEEELSAALYLMDVSDDLVSAVKFLIWLLPKVITSPNNGRNIQLLPRNVEGQVCEVGEAFLISSLRRYENILLATDLLPEVLSATMHRASSLMTLNGRLSGSAALLYSRSLLKRYGNVGSVIEWEKSFKLSADKRLYSELESGQLLDGESGFPLGVPSGVEDLDDYFRQKISGVSRLPSRAGFNMREIVQKNVNVDDVFLYIYGKERKLFAGSTPKALAAEKWDDGYQIADKTVTELMDCMRQTGGAAQEGFPTLVSSAVSAIIGNIGPILAKIPDFRTGGYPSAADSLHFARRILRIHVSCLYLLKEAFGERQTRVFEVALATEACSALAGTFSPGKGSRNQSPESHDSNVNEVINSSSKVMTGRETKAAAVSALLIGAVINGITSLERLVTVFRFREKLDIIQFVRNSRSNLNGNARSTGALKGDNSLEVYVHWFRLLVGNCRTVSDGMVVELLGEPSIIALSRMQGLLPLRLVFPPAYSIFAFVIWWPFLLNTSLAIREDMNQLYQSFATAVGDIIKHLPFRDVCLRDSQGFYDLVAADGSDAEFAAMMEVNGADIHLNSRAFVPLRARLFLNALLDCKMPGPLHTQGEGNHLSGSGESKMHNSERETKLVDKLVHILDTLQPAKFHWQWIELRLLLNEQALIDKLEIHDMSLVDAIRSFSPSPEKAAASENEKHFIEIILTRLLVRPDAAALFSDVVHLFGRSLADSMLLQVKWFLGGSDVLLGRKTIRQRLVNIAENKGLSTKTHFWKPWGWFTLEYDILAKWGDKKKFEVTSLEEGEMVEEGTESKKHREGSSQIFDKEGHVTERALIELLLPCIDQSSDDSRSTFANDLIKQLSSIEQQISAVTRGPSKQAGQTPGIEVPASKGNNRKGIRGGSPGLARRAVAVPDSAPPLSPAALRASMSLRLQLLLRLLPIIYVDSEPSAKNMRHGLASVVLRLLGSRVVHGCRSTPLTPSLSSLTKRDSDSSADPASASITDISSESLFDELLLVLHGLLSSCQPHWLRSSKPTKGSGKGFAAFDRDLAENLQNDLDRLQLPDSIRWRIQAAMPLITPSVRCLVACQPPSVPNMALAVLQPSGSISGINSANLNPPQKNQLPLARTVTSATGKSKPLPSQDNDMEIDPWTLLEDGAGSGPSSSNSSLTGSTDHGNLLASSWLKGAVRVRRKDLTYIGAVDDDS